VEIGEHSALCGTMAGASNAAFAPFFVLRVVLTKMNKVTLKLTIITVKDAASAPVSAGRRQ
jgi:hypothetical protein